VTIPQICSFVGWGLLVLAGAFTALHTINMIVDGVDFIFPTSWMGGIAFLISIPLAVVGLVLGLVGMFWERIHERQYDDHENMQY